MKGVARKGAEAEMLDYIMSEKFGFNWKEYDAVRIQYFIHILSCIRKFESKN